MEPGPGVVAEVRDCILRFYTSHDAREREEAERALAAFVKSDDSWRVTLHVLERDDATPVEGVFCAQTLHALIRRCVRKETRTQASHAAFTESDWVDLRARVLKLTAKFAMRSCAANAVDMRSALTKLSLSLAALGCKMNAWESDAVVRDVVEYFSNDASTTNEAKLLCLCTFLAFIPEEATSRDLSLHPQRRQDVLAALKASANDVMELLEQLAASAGADVMLHKYILDALSAWADVADVTAKFPRVILGGALQIVGTDGHQSSLKQSAANALKGALQQCVWTKNGELRETLAASMGSLRQAIAQPAVSVETKTLLSEVFSSIALTSLRNQKDATRNPLATGPDAAGDRVYVKHSEFKHLQRQQKKEQRKEQKLKTNIAVDIDEEVLVFSLDALSELLASGVSMASALEPWGKLAKSFIPEDFVAGSLRTVAARCMQAAVSYVCTQSRTDLEDDSQKEEFADCLRDVISTVSIENILGDFNESFHAELNAATEKGWKRIHARLYALLALTKSFQSGANQSSFTVLIETLSLLLVTDGVPVHVAESSCWVLAGLSKAIDRRAGGHIAPRRRKRLDSEHDARRLCRLARRGGGDDETLRTRGGSSSRYRSAVAFAAFTRTRWTDTFRVVALGSGARVDDFVEEFDLLCRVWRRCKSGSGERLRHACPTSHLCAQFMRGRSPNKRLCQATRRSIWTSSFGRCGACATTSDVRATRSSVWRKTQFTSLKSARRARTNRFSSRSDSKSAGRCERSSS